MKIEIDIHDDLSDEQAAELILEHLHIALENRHGVIDRLLEKLKGFKSKLDDETWRAALQRIN
jgi:hypothetical protein